MKYYSNYKGISDKIKLPCQQAFSFKDALMMGASPDGGLLMPEKIPVFSNEKMRNMSKLPMHEMAAEIIYPYLENEVSQVTLKSLCKAAFQISIPLEQWNENILLAYLDRGPSESFKDFAAAFLSVMMDYFKEEEQNLSIVVSTSGDTGGAIASAFSRMKDIRVCILYPEKEISPEQRRQLNAVHENVISIEVADKFDICQDLAKQALNDPELKNFGLSSANSINIARVLAQMVYYFEMYFRVANYPEEIIFSIPTGNMGNALACEMARRMGLPVEKILLACNSNNVVPEFLASGDYLPVLPSKNAISNAMNVGNPSNMARFFYLYYGALSKDGRILSVPDMQGMRKNLWSISVSDEETRDIMREAKREKEILLDPHGACALFGACKYFEKEQSIKTVVLQTASPKKFSHLINSIFNEKIFTENSFHTIPARYKINGDYLQFKNLLMNKWNG